MAMNRKRVRGFTIVELLVVITIIGMLMAMLMPAVSKVRSQVQRAQCINNQRQIAIAVISASGSSSGKMPRTLERMPAHAIDPTNQKWHGWVVTLMRELNHGDVYDKLLDIGIETGASRSYQVYLEDLICPSNKPPNFDGAPLSYVANGGQWDDFSFAPDQPADWKANGAWSNNVCLETQPAVDITMSYISRHDGVSTTLLLGENVNAENWNQDTLNEEHVAMIWHWREEWNIPYNEELDQPLTQARARPSSFHDGGFVVAFCDGSARYLSENLPIQVYCRLMSSYGHDTGKANKVHTIGNFQDFGYQLDPIGTDELRH